MLLQRDGGDEPKGNIFNDKHISLEPEMRSLHRFLNLMDYEEAK